MPDCLLKASQATRSRKAKPDGKQITHKERKEKKKKHRQKKIGVCSTSLQKFTSVKRCSGMFLGRSPNAAFIILNALKDRVCTDIIWKVRRVPVFGVTIWGWVFFTPCAISIHCCFLLLIFSWWGCYCWLQRCNMQPQHHPNDSEPSDLSHRCQCDLSQVFFFFSQWSHSSLHVGRRTVSEVKPYRRQRSSLGRLCQMAIKFMLPLKKIDWHEQIQHLL